jgi:DNA-binding transcriptional MerR regulator
MLISELARLADVTIPTVKYYLRQELLAPGEAITTTQAEYTQAHVDRLRLIRALVDVAGLSLTAVRKVLETIERPGPAAGEPGAGAVGAVGQALIAAQAALPPAAPLPHSAPSRALAAVSALGWQVDQDSLALRQLEAALVALDMVGLPPSVSTLLTYAEAAGRAAAADVASLPDGPPDEVVPHVVLSTVMHEPLLLALRRLALQNGLLKHEG